ncbi:Exportin-4 [Schistosoma japonicum]|uniref:Exportin-4 n=1 Tax=Schistosoma japonicum TaxID=6182 RepID=A0A4Z2DVZ9_SCHJA|nr:Exportin-4 [Schistosoma japonicum]
MDDILKQLEEAATAQLLSVKSEDRKRAEEKILQFRAYSEPYEICTLILTRSNNDCLLYEAGRCLSHAVVREWNSVFASSYENVNNCKALQLLTFILEWSQSRGFECGPAARQRILSAAGALVKRAAAAHAENAAAAWRSAMVGESVLQRPGLGSRILTTPPDDPGPPCWLLTKLIEHIEELIQPLTQSNISDITNDQETILKRGLLGLFILSALLDEFSYSEDSAQLNLPLEAHVFLQTRFQDYELVRLFKNLLCLVNHLLVCWSSQDCSTLSQEQSEVVFRIISCLDMITSWDFVPSELIRFHASPFRRSDQEARFRPSAKWIDIIGSEALPRTILLFIKLHTWVRGSDLLGARTLSCLVRFSLMSGPLVYPNSSLTCVNNNSSYYNGNSSTFDQNQSLSSPSTIHYLILIENLNCWLGRGWSLNDSTQISFESFMDQVPGIRDEISNRIADCRLIPSLSLEKLLPYELPILSELILNLVLNSSRAWEPVERVLSLPKLSSPESISNETCQSMFHMGLISLWVMDKFFTVLSSLLIQCMRLLAESSIEADDDGQLAHEAVERLFNCWSDLIDLIPSSSSKDLKLSQMNHNSTIDPADDNSPLPLTTGQVQNFDQLAQKMKRLLGLLRSSNSSRQSQLFQFFLASKMVQPVGLRRICTNDNNEEINLELDEDDMTSSEDSLFAVGSCGLATPEESITTLLRLINERVAELIDLKTCESEASVDLFEDIHWLLLITGHLLVSGPASLTSVLRMGSPWDTQFSIPDQILYLGSETVDIVNSRHLISMSFGECRGLDSRWPPENLPHTHIPSFVILLCSLFRLLWLQVAYGVGSAQLVADNFWLMTRLAVTYFCYNVVDRDTLMSNISRSPIMTILHAAHHGTLSSKASIRENGLLEKKENSSPGSCEDTNRICIQGLLMCARLALDKWSHEPQVLSSLTRLLSVLSIHSPSPSSNLACSAWYDLCTIVCGPQASEHAWPNLSTDSLIQLVEACLCGSWSIDKLRMSSALTHDLQKNEDPDTLLLQLVREIRQQVLRTVNTLLSHDDTSFGSLQNASAIEVLVNCSSVLRGVARAIGSVASNSDSATDLISLVWNGLLGPFLSHGANYLVLEYHNYSEALQSLFSLFSDVADSCLIYLASLPSSSFSPSLPPNDRTTVAQSFEETNNVHNSFTAVCASSSFLNWTVVLCKHYTKIAQGKLNFEAAAEDDQVQALQLLLNLLSRVLYHEFELRLSGAAVLSHGGNKLVIQSEIANSQDAASSTIPTVDAAVIGLGHLLPLITESILTIPELCQAFYSFASYACELRAQGFMRLTDCQLSSFSRLLRFGIFGLNFNISDQIKSPSTSRSLSYSLGCVDNSVIQQCLDIIISLTDHFLEIRSRSRFRPTEELQNATRLINAIGLNTQFLSDLFTLITRESYSVSLEASFSSALLNLIHLNPEAYSNLVYQWINSCENPVIQARLNDAFEHLGNYCSSGGDGTEQTNKQLNDSLVKSKYITCFNENKPNRSSRSDFQQYFHLFVTEMRSFICFG